MLIVSRFNKLAGALLTDAEFATKFLAANAVPASRIVAIEEYNVRLSNKGRPEETIKLNDEELSSTLHIFESGNTLTIARVN